MKNSLNIAKCVGFLALLLLSSPTNGAPIDNSQPKTNLRGSVIKIATNASIVIVPRIRVELYKAEKRVGTTYTDSGGFYYFSNITPGKYTIRINQKRFKITVKPKVSARQFQDILPIRLS